MQDETYAAKVALNTQMTLEKRDLFLMKLSINQNCIKLLKK